MEVRELISDVGTKKFSPFIISVICGWDKEGKGYMNSDLGIEERAFWLCILFLALTGSSFGIEQGLWGRNPFLTRKEIASIQEKAVPVSNNATIPHWDLKSILISGPDRVAIIDDYIVTVGDYIRGMKVIKINRSNVVLSGNLGKTILRLKQPSIPIETEKKIR
jgi:hypothetical protein